jgi:hypothetical protein
MCAGHKKLSLSMMFRYVDMFAVIQKAASRVLDPFGLVQNISKNSGARFTAGTAEP